MPLMSNTDQESANSEFLTQEVEEAFELLGVPLCCNDLSRRTQTAGHYFLLL